MMIPETPLSDDGTELTQLCEETLRIANPCYRAGAFSAQRIEMQRLAGSVGHERARIETRDGDPRGNPVARGNRPALEWDHG